jgi:membrane protease YdiL (CAAX protease family)
VTNTQAARGTFRSGLGSRLGLNVTTGLLLLAGFTLARVILVLQANVTGSYQVTGAVFVLMAVLPFLLLTRAGRERIGLVRPARWRWMLPALAAGVACAVAVFGLAVAMYGFGVENPFVYISYSYANVPGELSGTDRLIFFTIFALIGMTFSPIGEELFYRGLVHESLADSWGNRRAAIAEAGAFAVAHLAHFGIVYIAGAWALLPVPALLWVTAMFASALVFYAFRVLGGSLLGSVVAHAGFNLAMNYVIFFVVLP